MQLWEVPEAGKSTTNQYKFMGGFSTSAGRSLLME